MWKTITVNRPLLVEAINATVGKVKYQWGAKPHIDSLPGSFTKADCSGFVRWLLHYITEGEFTIPEGTWAESKYFAAQGFKKTAFANTALMDDRLRVCVFTQRGDVPGHIWLTVNGLTIESYGGKGVGRRKWNTLAKHKPACYVLTQPMS